MLLLTCVVSPTVLGQNDTTVLIGGGSSVRVIYHLVSNDKPLVVLQAGARSHSEAWSALIPDLIEEGYSVLSYDRPGLGLSDPSKGDRTGMMISMELRGLIRRMNINKELILVGHSMGGMYQSIYNDFYPESVKGLVMIDTPSSAWEELLRACLTRNQNEARDSSLTAMRAVQNEAVRREHMGAGTSFDYMENIKLKNSLIIISGGQQSWPEDYDGDCLSEAWEVVQSSLKNLNDEAVHWVSESSGHGIPHQDPEIIIKAIKLLSK